MDDEMTVNLTASLRSAAADLSSLANGLVGLSTDEEIEQRAKILDCIAEDASQSAAILRAVIVPRKHPHGLVPKRVPRDSTSAHQVLPGPGSDKS